jgi:serine/threonine-protein kinase
VADDDAPPRRRRRRRALLVALAVALVAGAASAWWFLVRVPVHDVGDYVGQDVGEVRSDARSFGWELDDDTLVRRDGTVAGEVVDQDPAAGTGLAEGGTLTVTVSLGPTLVPVPAVAGLPETEARAALGDAGLAVGAVSRAADEEVPEGAVVSAAPAPGQEDPDATGQVPKGTRFTLVVSDGPAPRVVPEGLVGVPVADARARLATVQLEAAVTEQFDETVAAGVVLSAGVPPGTELERGTAVPLFVSKGPAPVQVPNVLGQSGTTAASNLQAAGFSVSGIEGSPSGAVLATDPPAGELVPRGSAIRIFTRS